MQTDVPRCVKQALLNVYAKLFYHYGIRETLVALWNLMDPQSHCDIGVGWYQGDLEILQTQGHHGDTVETHGTLGTVTQQGLMEPRSEL